MKGILVFSGSGPLLLLSSYPTIDDPALVARLHAKGLTKFIAHEIPVEHCQELYGHFYTDVVRDLEKADDVRVLDFDGHRIFLNFSLRTLGPAYVYEPAGAAAAA